MTETRDKVADRGLAGDIMDGLWPILGGNHTPAETWAEISEAIDSAITRRAALQAPAVGGVGWKDNDLKFNGRVIGDVRFWKRGDHAGMWRAWMFVEDEHIGWFEIEADARQALETAAKLWLGLTGEDWRPISTAPRDGTEILAAIQAHSSRNGGSTYWERHVIAFNEDTGRIADDLGWEWDDYTHWQPLPAAPTPEPEKGGEAPEPDFPSSCCTSWEDCRHDKICHDPDLCGFEPGETQAVTEKG